MSSDSPSPKLQPVTTDHWTISTVRVPRKGGGWLSFNLTQPLTLKRGDSYVLENCRPTASSVVPITDDSGNPILWSDGTPATRTQIDTVELKFLVKRANGRKTRIHWRYGEVREAGEIREATE